MTEILITIGALTIMFVILLTIALFYEWLRSFMRDKSFHYKEMQALKERVKYLEDQLKKSEYREV